MQPISRGLPLTLQRYEAQTLFWAANEPPAQIRRAISNLNLTQRALSPGSGLQIEPSLSLEILPSRDERPLLLLRYSNLRLPLAGENWLTSTLSALRRTGDSVDGVTLRGEGGLRLADEALTPGILIGTPTQPLPRGWLTTGLHGTLILSSDGQTLTLRRER